MAALALPLWGESGNILNADVEGVNVDFRFAIAQPDKTWTCDDLKYGLVNRRCAADTPSKLPTGGHIGHIFLRIRHPGRPWPFFKEDHKADYKNYP